tara:strand:+ start:174 stop:347 length:174 start_codon:yes stop_codon:yes gene_type:complete
MPEYVVTKTVTEEHVFIIDASDELAAEIEALNHDKYYCNATSASYTDVSITDVKELC